MKWIIVINIVVILYNNAIGQCNKIPIWEQILFPSNCQRFGAYLIPSSIPSCNTNDYVLVFEDNFNGNSLDTTKWQIQPWGQGALYGNGGRNQEYNSLDNIEVSNGTLKIIAKKETVTKRAIYWKPDSEVLSDGLPNLRTYNYTSSNIWTKNKFFHGKYEMRCRVPNGMGFWPAFWVFGGQRWNEIDFFEIYGDNIDEYTCNIHHDYDGDGCSEKCPYSNDNLADFSQWHTFTCEFSSMKIVWSIDNSPVRILYRISTISGWVIDCGESVAQGVYAALKSWPIENMYIIANMAIETGDKSPNDNTVFPAVFEIDYIRYYKKKDCCNNITITSISDLNLNSDPDVYNFICGKDIVVEGVTIPDGANVTLVASDSIILEDGFDSGNCESFIAKVEPSNCNSNKGSVQKQDTSMMAINNDKYIYIYPNPSNGIFKIEFDYGVDIEETGISIFDVNGKKVYQDIIKDNIQEINLSSKEKGIYLIYIVDEKNKSIYSNKLIIE